MEIILVGADSGDGVRGEAKIQSFDASEIADQVRVTAASTAEAAGDGLALVVARF